MSMKGRRDMDYILTVPLYYLLKCGFMYFQKWFPDF